jgi:hypothetical protein
MAFMLAEKYAFISLDTIYGFKPNSNELKFMLDEIQDGSISGDVEVNWMTGRRQRRLAAIKNNKTCTITANNGFVVGGLLAAQIGDSNPISAHDSADIRTPFFERIVVGTGDTISLAHEAVGSTGDEIGVIYRANKDGSQGEPFTQAATPSAIEFAFDGVNEIELPTNAFSEGDVVLVFYHYMTKGVRYTNRSADYAGSAKLVCEVLVKDICSGKELVSTVTFPKVEISDSFNISFGSDAAVHNFEAEAVADACGGSDQDYFYWDIPDEDAA